MQEFKSTFESNDGTQLFYRSWRPERFSKAVVLLHRGHEHSARWSEVVKRLDLRDTAVFAWDARGHGHSPGPRGYAESFGTLVSDLDTFMRHLCAEYDLSFNDFVLLGHSVGGVIAATWVHDFAPPIRGLILSSPAFRIRLYVPFAIPGLRLITRLKDSAYISSYVKGRLLTHDTKQQKAYDSDPLITQRISVNVLIGLYDAATRLLQDAATIDIPVLLMTSGSDFVVHQGPQRKFFARLPNRRKRMRIFPDFRHDMFSEIDRDQPISEVRDFISDLLADRPRRIRLEQSDRYGATQAEYQELNEPLSAWSPRSWKFMATRGLMRSAGRLSVGIQLGLSEGFDSGIMLDYVYQNKANGSGGLGRVVDRIFLNSPGWVGIRNRKRHVESLLTQAIAEVRSSGKVPHIVDLAAGRGRYVIDVLEKLVGKATATLFDYCPLNVAAGEKLARNLSCGDIRFKRSDAFDPGQVLAATKDADIILISGLYELFSDNGPVSGSLEAVSAASSRGAYLIYTNQPWHPQLELIARTLNSHRDGQPWIMRRRAQGEMDRLVENAGFRKIRQLIDDAGIFSVSLARRTQTNG